MKADLTNQQEWARFYRGKVNFAGGDFRELQGEIGRRFDILVSFGVVEHFEDPASLIRAFGGHLREGGVMLTVCPNTAGAAMHLQKHVDKAVYDGHLRFDVDQLVDYGERGIAPAAPSTP